MRTRPSESNVAVCSSRAAVIEPVGLKAPVVGSYSSAEARRSSQSPPFTPPAKRTRPSESNVAVSDSRALAIEPVGLKVPVRGSYSSAEDRIGAPHSPAVSLTPPAMRTRPSESKVAVWNSRAVVIEPVWLKPGVGAGSGVGLGLEAGLELELGTAVGVGAAVGDTTGALGEQPAIAAARSRPAGPTRLARGCGESRGP